MGSTSVFPSPFFNNKIKQPYILNLSITRVGLSFEIQKQKIERPCLAERGYDDGCWSSTVPHKMGFTFPQKQSPKTQSVDKL